MPEADVEPRPDIPPTEALAVLEPAPSAELVLVGDPPPAARDPRVVYLASLTTEKSRRAMAGALDRIARAIAERSGRAVNATTFAWEHLRYAQTTAIRAALAEKHAPTTANHALAALRGVLREASRLGLISAEDLARAIDLKPVRGTRLPKGRALASDEIRKLINVCDATSIAGARDAALVGLLYNCGLRREEVVALDLANYDAAEQRFRVTGKGRKEREAYVTAAAELLIRWLARRGDAPGPVFLPVDKSGRLGTRRLSDQAVLFLLHRLAERAEVALFSPHDMRRTFISDLLDAGADISVVQGMAGHAQVTTTQRYDRRGEKAKRRAAGLIKL